MIDLLGTESDQDQNIDLSSESYTPPPDQRVIDNRSLKAAYGAGTPQALPEFRNQISVGDESFMRRNLADQKAIADQKRRNDILYGIATQKGGNLSPEDLALVQGLSSETVQHDPETIVEHIFANRFVNDIIQRGLDNQADSIAEGLRADQNKALDSADFASNVITKQQAFQRNYEDTASEAHQRGVASKVWDFMKSVAPGVSWLNLWNRAKTTRVTIGGTGSMISDLVRDTWGKPNDEAIAQARRITRELYDNNPEDALVFAAALLRYTSSDEMMNNAASVADVATFGGIARKAGAKLFGKAIGSVIRDRSDIAAGVHVSPETAPAGSTPAAPARVPGQPPAGLKYFVEDVGPEPKPPSPKPTEGPQLELFSRGDRTQTELFPNDLFREQPTPPPTAGLPPGKLRSTFVPLEQQQKGYPARNLITGRMEREPKQLEMNLSAPHQMSLDFSHVPTTPAQATRLPPLMKDPFFRILDIEDKAKSSALDSFNTAMAHAVQAVDHPARTPADMIAESGNIPGAAQVLATQKLSGQYGLDDLLKELPSAGNPSGFLGRGSVIAAERARRLGLVFQRMTGDVIDSFMRTPHVPRITEEAKQAGFRAVEEEMWRDYGTNPRVNDGLLNVVHVPAEAFAENNDKVVFQLGNPFQAGLFTSKAEAKNFAENIYGFEPGEYFPVQRGSDWMLHVVRNVDETQDYIRDLLVTPKNVTPVSVTNKFLSRIKSTDLLLSKEQNERRKLAEHVPTNVARMLKEQFDETSRRLTRDQRKRVERILEENRDWENPQNGARGRWFQNDQEFENAYMNRFNLLPTEEETNHYFNYTRLSDIEWFFRNLAKYRDKARKGIDQASFDFIDSNGQRQSLPHFEGRKVSDIPWGGADGTVAVYDPFSRTLKSTQLKIAETAVRPTIKKSEIDALLKDGWEVYHVYDPKLHPLKAMGLDAPVNFIVTKNFNRKALGYKQLDYAPGGHSIYRDPWYLAQPVIVKGLYGREYYYGDANAFNFASEAKAKEFLEHLHEAQRLLRSNDPGLNAYLAAHIPVPRQKFEEMFTSGRFDINKDFSVKRAGLNTFETNTSLKAKFPDVIDATKSPHDLSTLEDRAFTADRDHVLPSFAKEPVISMVPSRQINPYSALNRGMAQAINDLWMNDYKIGAIEQWYKEFSGVMKPSEEKLFDAPLYYLYHFEPKATAERDVLAAAKANRRAILNFIGQRSELQTDITWAQNKLKNSIYRTFGEGRTAKTLNVISDAMLPLVRDPASYARAIAFHSQLGMFNPVQLLVQAQSMNHIYAIAGPKTGWDATVAAFLARRLAHTDDSSVINHFANIASRLSGFSQTEFKEMLESLKASGIYNVVSEAALRNETFDPKLYRSSIGRFLDKGTMFFAEGERLPRLMGHAAAYKEWRKANPGRVLDDRALGEISERGDLLSVNMTRKSLSDFQHGIFGIPTQFATFQLRMMEQFLGKKLTTTEKARGLAWYSMMYGIPAGIGGTAFGFWPWYDDIREEGLARGYDMNSTVMQALSNGMLGVIVSTLTGKEYDTSRLAPGGFTPLRDFVRGDKGFGELMLGASGSIIKSLAESTYPLTADLAAAISGNPDAFPAQPEDISKFMKEFQTFNLAAKIRGILWYGNYYSKQNNLISDKMEPVDAVMATLGLTPQHINDSYRMLGQQKDERAANEDFKKHAMEQYKLAAIAWSQGEQEKYREYMTRAQFFINQGRFTFEEKHQIFMEGSRFAQPLEDKARFDFMVKKARPDQAIDRYNSFFKRSP